MREKIITFLSLTGIDKFPDIMSAGVLEQIKGQFSEPVAGNVASMFLFVEQTLDAQKSMLLDTIVAAYADSFTESDIDKLVAFYEAPLGRRVVELGGIVLPSVVEAGNTWCADTMKSIEGEVQKLLA